MADEPEAAFAWRLLAAGMAFWLVLAAEQVVLWGAAPEQARAMLAHLVAELAGGREAGVPVGLAAGEWRLLAWQTSFLQDMATALTAFPLLLWLLARYKDRDWYAMRRLRRIEEKAAEHRAYVARWGPLGLGIFIIMPYLVNGPFVSLVLGRLGGIPVRRMLPFIVAGTVVAAGLWTFLFDVMIGLGERIHPAAGLWLAGLAVIVVVTVALVDFVRDRRRHASSEEE